MGSLLLFWISHMYMDHFHSVQICLIGFSNFCERELFFAKNLSKCCVLDGEMLQSALFYGNIACWNLNNIPISKFLAIDPCARYFWINGVFICSLNAESKFGVPFYRSFIGEYISSLPFIMHLFPDAGFACVENRSSKYSFLIFKEFRWRITFWPKFVG